MAKEFLSQKGIAFEERNITLNAEYRRELVEQLGYRSIPIIRAGDEVIVGFDAARLEALVRRLS